MQVVYFITDRGPLYITEFGFSRRNTPKTVGPYIRDTYVLHYVLEGVCHFDGFDVHKGEAFLISKQKLHSFSVEPPYSHIWFTFGGTNAGEILEQFKLTPYDHALLKVSDSKFADKLAELAISNITSTEHEAIAKSILLSFLPLSAPIVTENKKRACDMQTAARFIRKHYHRHLSMNEIASILHLSEKYFYKLFKAEFGIPPQQYLYKVRMEKAVALLKSGNLKIKQISDSVGYSSQLVFSNAFKKYYRVSPSDYLKSENNSKT